MVFTAFVIHTLVAQVSLEPTMPAIVVGGVVCLALCMWHPILVFGPELMALLWFVVSHPAVPAFYVIPHRLVNSVTAKSFLELSQFMQHTKVKQSLEGSVASNGSMATSWGELRSWVTEESPCVWSNRERSTQSVSFLYTSVKSIKFILPIPSTHCMVYLLVLE